MPTQMVVLRHDQVEVFLNELMYQSAVALGQLQNEEAEAELRRMMQEFPVYRQYDINPQLGPNVHFIKPTRAEDRLPDFREGVTARIMLFAKDSEMTGAKYVLRVVKAEDCDAPDLVIIADADQCNVAEAKNIENPDLACIKFEIPGQVGDEPSSIEVRWVLNKDMFESFKKDEKWLTNYKFEDEEERQRRRARKKRN